jgi:hypothetical protein
LSTNKEIDKAIAETAYNYIVNIRGQEIFGKSSVLQSTWYTVYFNLLVASMLNLKINKQSSVAISGTQMYLVDIIQRLDLFIEPVEEDDDFKIQFPKYVTRNFTKLNMVIHLKGLT